MGEKDRPRPGRDRGEDRLDHLVRRGQRQRHMRLDVASAALLAEPLPAPLAGPVLQVGADHLIARLERERSGHHVDAGRRVGHKNQIVSRAAEIGGHRGARLVQQVLRAPSQELDRLPLQLALPAAVLGEHRLRRGPERPVVEEDDVGIEQELLAQRLRRRRAHGHGQGQRHEILPKLRSPLPPLPSRWERGRRRSEWGSGRGYWSPRPGGASAPM